MMMMDEGSGWLAGWLVPAADTCMMMCVRGIDRWGNYAGDPSCQQIWPNRRVKFLEAATAM